MSESKEDLKKRYMSVEDKAAVKAGTKHACAKIKYCGERFSEMIFIISLLAAAVLQIVWTFALNDTSMSSFGSIMESLIKTVHYLICAALVFLAWKDNEKVKFYFGFFESTAAKTFFYLFCAVIIYPIDYEGTMKGMKVIF